MADEKRLEDLRSKIMESIGKSDRDLVPIENKRHITDNAVMDAHVKRQKNDSELPKAPKSRDAPHSHIRGISSSTTMSANRTTYEQTRAGPYRRGYRDASGRSYNRENRFNSHTAGPQWSNNSYGRQRDERRGRNERSDRRGRNGNGNYDHSNYQRKNEASNFNGDRDKRQLQTNKHDMNYNSQNVMYPGSSFDSPAYYNMASSKANSRLVISGLSHSSNPKIVANLKDLLENFVLGLQETESNAEDFKIANYFIGEGRPDHIIVEFSSQICSTMVLACRSFFSMKLGTTDLKWGRPNDYIQQLDHLVGFCRGTVIALEESENMGEGGEGKMEEFLSSFNVKKGTAKPLFYKSSSSANNTGKDFEFTKCALILFEVVTQDVLDKLKPYKWFKPNDGKTSQVTSWITFQSLPNLVTQSVRVESRVLLLLNCLDPLDLKDETFITEIKETLKYSITGIDTIKICQPGVDYRLNFENLASGAGNIYVKFKTLEAAKHAMEELPGTQFNDRTVLCTYIDEDDFDMLEVTLLS
ncbi:Mud2p [Saccharomyces paradoxus]|uniref:Mud2p n=1 Tax=Saccharomyces paradoxus TaxID=27291 RepID=A0A8B8UV10_SACPA|nr:Mud2 [Saccharomyces paradoxus]QHS74519.1 Mud2 [Saccharomyces paradoxus]